MTTTRKFLTKFNQAWADNDVDTIVNSVTDDIHFKMVTDAEGIRGKEAFSSWLKDMSNNDFQMALTTDRVIIDGDQAAITGTMAMTKPDGTKSQFSYCDLYRLRDGKVAELMAFVMDHDKQPGCPGDTA